MKLFHCSFFLLRAPSLPLNSLQEINKSRSDQELKTVFRLLFHQNPEILTAIIVSSQHFGRIIQSWLIGSSALEEKHLSTLYKYISRMATRATPFGISAGTAIGTVSKETTHLEIESTTKIHSRLGASFLAKKFSGSALTDSLSKLLIHRNSTLFYHEGHFRYAQKSASEDAAINRVKIKVNPLLKLVYQKVSQGSTYQGLASYLVKNGLNQITAQHYINQLIYSEFLISDIEPSLSGNRYRKLLSNLPLPSPLSKLAANVSYRIDHNAAEMLLHWENLSQETEENLLPELEINRQFIPVKVNIDRNLMGIIAKELSELIPFAEPIEVPEIEFFKKQFIAKYDLQEVPLLEVMDSDISIGYGDKTEQYRAANPLLKSLTLLTVPLPKRSIRSQINKGLIANKRSIELDTSEIKLSENTEIHNPATSFAFGTLHPNSGNAEDFSFQLKSWGGASSITMMARFAEIDPVLKEKLQECAVQDQQAYEDFIVAEIAHTPHEKDSNILCRPDFYPYEIPLLGNSSKAKEFQIPLQDIVISVKNNKIYLRSLRLGKYIIPRISSAHNYKRGNPIYRFFGDLQFQYAPNSFRWNWKELEKNAFLPRITYKHLVLSRARWYIEKQIIKKPDHDLINVLIENYKLDHIVLIAEGDNELYIDLRTTLGQRILCGKLRKGAVILYEFFAPGEPILRNNKKQSFLNELVIPFRSKIESIDVPAPQTVVPQHSPRRTFPPGSRWSYMKLYCISSIMDEILLTSIDHIADQLQKKGIVDKWFFVRFNDPAPHLRIRFHHPKSFRNAFQATTEIFQTQLNPLIETNKILSIQYDTYERELERYGLETIEIAESIFALNSTMVLRLLGSEGNSGPHFQWLAAIKGIDSLFNSFNVDIKDRILFSSRWAENLKLELSVSKNDVRQINNFYRTHKEILQSFLHLDADDKETTEIIFSQHESAVRKVLKPLKKKQMDFLRSAIGSIVHMFLNRLFSTDHRANEMVIYSYTAQYYKTVSGQSTSKMI